MADLDEADDGNSRADRAAEKLRRLLTSGGLVPGQRLSESAVSERLGVSRNTLREAFRMLTHERLLVHKPHAGVFVAVPSLASIIDIYRVRRMIECQALLSAPARHPASRRMRAAVESAQASRDADDWIAVGTANMEFHSAIVALADSDHLDRLYANISAELRLAFFLLDDPDYLHRPYVELNVAMLDLYLAGEAAEAAAVLDDYLLKSERTIVAAYARQLPA
ncbi:GntR family transcriptional regulator [Cryobacterium adonitolivorans]|uniref:GntR family transcriptional regulator n=1 Tax=Cryobacterium adonitolivorans TaxID=1259189 RepID=A0A4R8W7E1_9MICO|nr:GntR family transcriptional regulator [Cryobacterium adonitolivorans]TFC04085.1 GntR family transcriptional regulator [Cryobacterium adonitolivorans]